MKSVLILNIGELHAAPRIYRTYMALKNDYKITTAGFTPIFKEEHIDLSACLSVKKEEITFHLKYPFLLRKFMSLLINFFVLKTYSKRSFFEKKYWSNFRIAIFKMLKTSRFDIVIVHGIDALPIGVKLCEQTKAKLVFNAHEYYPKEFEEDAEWIKNTQPYYVYICSTYLRKVDLFINVSENIRKEYLKNFGLDSIVITNASNYRELPVNLCHEKIKIVHHGAALRSRNIDLMIKCAGLLNDNFSFDLMLVPTDKVYYNEIKQTLINNNKIKLISPVEFNTIPEFLNKYDIGLYILPTNNFNNEMALPNKFFEFIQARLMLAISPNPEMAAIIKKYKLGITAPDFTPESLAHLINRFSCEEVNQYKLNTSVAAKELNSEVNARILLEKINEMFKCAA